MKRQAASYEFIDFAHACNSALEAQGLADWTGCICAVRLRIAGVKSYVI
jgi:hypothetical protein